MNQEIITKILQEYDIKNPSKQVKSAIQQFAFKYAQKLLLTTKEIAGPEKINETHLRVAYDLIHNIHTPQFELAEDKYTKEYIKVLNSNESELKSDGGVTSVKLPIYGLRNSMTAKDIQLGLI